MISVRLQGRLGNQLFQYAFAHATSRKLNTNFVIDHTLEQAIIYKYFELSKSFPTLFSRLFNIRGFKNIFSYYIRINFSKVQSLLLPYKKLIYPYDVDPSKVLNHLQDNTLYVGYFQSEAYFIAHREEILKAFTLKKSITQKYDHAYKQLFKNYTIVCVHIRKSDYQFQSHLNLGHDDISLPMNYYHQVISTLNNENAFFIFTSDEPQLMEKEFAYLKNKHISLSDEITDFQHMLNADICVISNSTFSWWSAYLNKKPNRIVYCPKYFLGFHLKETVPTEIYPNNWLQVNFNE
jgi:hypothetical protein